MIREAMEGVRMSPRRIGPALASIAALMIACGGAPSAGTGSSAAPSASTPPSAPAQTATAQPSAAPSAAPQSAYLDDRSSPEQLIRSYYDAIARHQYLRAYGYWETSSTLPTYDAFAKGFADTSTAQVELGTVGGGAGAGQLNLGRDRKSTRLNSSHVSLSRM